VKRCPTCNKTFTEEHLSFCVDDGTPLATIDPVDDEATVVRSGEADSSSGSSAAPSARDSQPYQPPGSPGSYIPPGSYGASKSRTWPWLLGIFAIVFIVFVGLGVGAVVLLPRMMRASNRNANLNANVERLGNLNENSADANSNLNSNATVSNNNDSPDEGAPPPTDEAEVLSDLTDLEHEWTVANINADKKKLDRILADDYVGVTDGRTEGKAQYLKTIKRDTVIQKWSFENLKVNLAGDRATLTGILRVDLKNEQGEIRPGAFRFTDKFVWRDERWQATGSEVKLLEE
jgi:type II secretory pathway pseudopilin PulG